MQFCKEKGGVTINEKTYHVCANFLFYTSMYEEKLFNSKDRHKPENDKKISQELLNSGIIDLADFDYFGEFLCKRYLDDVSANENFRNLKLGDQIKKSIKKSLIDFKNDRKRDSDLIFAYIQITYRFRNNMFHGSKGLINLNHYSEQFGELNKFLRHLLSEIIDKKYNGFNQE